MKQRKREFLKKRRSQTVVCDLRELALDLEALFASGAYDGVRSLGFWQTKHRTAGGTFAIDVRLAVAEFVATKTEKSTKAVVFATALDDVS